MNLLLLCLQGRQSPGSVSLLTTSCKVHHQRPPQNFLNNYRTCMTLKKRFSIRYVEPGMSISSCSTVWEFLSSDPCTVQLLARSAVPSCTSLCRPSRRRRSSALCRLIKLSGFPTFFEGPFLYPCT